MFCGALIYGVVTAKQHEINSECFLEAIHHFESVGGGKGLKTGPPEGQHVTQKLR